LSVAKAAQRSVKVVLIWRRLAASTWTRLAVFTAVAVISKWFWLSSAGAMVDFRDAQYVTLFEDAARISVLDFHELPLWNPYYCGGIYSLSTPSARFSSPTFLLTLVFGVLRASPLLAVLACVCGLEGMYRYARSVGASPLGAMVGAPAFALSGFFARSGAFEWINFLGFELLPWAALGVRRALDGDVRGAVLAAVAIGWMTCFGGTYAAPYMLLVALWELGSALIRFRRDRGRIAPAVAMLTLTAMLSAAIAAVRLWPIGEALSHSPRLISALEGNGPLTIFHSLFGVKLPMRGDFLVGVLVLPLALLGAATSRRSLSLAFAAALWIWLASGYASHPSGYRLLRTIPPYTMLRSPERFLVPFSLAYAGLCARGFSALERIARRRGWSPHVVASVLSLAILNASALIDNDWGWQRGRLLLQPPAPRIEASAKNDFAEARGNRWLGAYYPTMNRGTLSCFDDYPVPQSATLRGDLPREEALVDDSAGTLSRRSWSPNRISLHVELKRAARVIVNQNWHPGWRSDLGTVQSDEDRLAIDLPQGSHDVTLRFLPRSAVGGGAATLLALLGCVPLWRFGTKRGAHLSPRQWTSAFGLATIPLAVASIVFLAVPEVGRPVRTPVLPNGEPVAQPEPPTGAQQVGAEFEEGISLEAVRIVPRQSEDGPTLDFELDWRLDHPAPPGLGIFVHLEPDTGSPIALDHVALAGAAPFEALPPKMILRDCLPNVAVAPSRTYNVYVGLWRARRAGERLRVLLPGTARVDGDYRLLVTTVRVP
jgi:hypothetical protein